MPVEIREMIIRADVRPPQRGSGNAAPGATGNKEEIISEAVERVLEILKREKER